MNDWGKKEYMVKFLTKSITFDEICKIHNIKSIEYLNPVLKIYKILENQVL